MNVMKVLCEYMNNPIGLDMEKPRFSWCAADNSELVGTQKSYRIIISDDMNGARRNIGNMWDSGVVKNDCSNNVPYDGKQKLQSATTYYVKVVVECEEGSVLESEIASFTTGLLHGEWKGDWIGCSFFDQPSCLYRTEIEIKKSVKSAMAFVSSPCYNVLTINGNKADTVVLNNANTDMDKTVVYASYIIDEYLNKGKNVIGLDCGQGWHAIKGGRDYDGWGESAFSAQILLRYEDGTEEWIYSVPANWYFTVNGPVKANSVFNGELYDARDEIIGWNMPDYVMDDKWHPTVEKEPYPGVVRAQYLEPIRIIKEMPVQEIYEVGDGSYTLNFGQNFAGWARIKIQEPAGTRIILKYAEVIKPDYSVDQENLRSAQQTDEYITKNDAEVVYEPRFTYHGFQYVQIFGLSKKPSMDTVVGCVVRSDVKRIGNFTCDNELLNRIYEIINWTEESNLHSIPTDCPQRDERLGWLNDMTVRNECALYNFRLPQLYSKWLQDIRDAQGVKSGAITDTAPFLKYGMRPADPVSTSFLLIPWNVYLQYGDKKIIEKNYDAMKRWIAFLIRNSDDYIVRYSQMGDWAGPITGTDINSAGAGAISTITPTILMGTGFLYYDCILMAKMAKVCSNSEDEAFYLQEADKTKKAFQKKWYNSEKKFYAKNSQAGNVFPLYLGIVPEEDRKDVLRNIVDDIKNKDTHLTTGNLCTRYAVEVLFQNGEENLAYNLLNQREYPSWGYMIENGATTVWERWEKAETGSPIMGMASRNHPMNGAVGVCFHKYIGGIQPDERQPGFKNVIIKPIIPTELNHVDCSLETIRGLIRSSWKKKKEGLSLKVEIPFNCTADIYIPVNGTSSEINSADIVYKNGTVIRKSDRILRCASVNEKAVKLHVTSGTYEFTAL